MRRKIFIFLEHRRRCCHHVQPFFFSETPQLFYRRRDLPCFADEELDDFSKSNKQTRGGRRVRTEEGSRTNNEKSAPHYLSRFLTLYGIAI